MSKLSTLVASAMLTLFLTTGKADIPECARCCKEIHYENNGENCYYYEIARCDLCAGKVGCIDSSIPASSCENAGTTRLSLGEACTCICQPAGAVVRCESGATPFGSALANSPYSTCSK